ncbi:MAG TPA: CDP-alcohol phosphatidyltransferase family protein [Bryobacteraceae bacterium]|nr:CDP-alcohol phosphatidyltransferase family protein [Bryobacteraceae bacterium]
MKHIPNLLSAARLAIAPYLFILLWRRQYSLALAICIIAGLTDGLDGLLARRLKVSSRVGAYLDPIADKVLLSGAFLTLAIDGAIERWLAVIVLGRDVMILLLVAGAFLLTTVRSFPPSFWGKASTVAQIAFIGLLLAHLSGFIGVSLVTTSKWLAAALACWSGAHYAWVAVTLSREARNRPRAAMMKV